jgi:pyrroline-5-carboxylate reductase
MTQKILFIGAGNMATALIGGLVNGGVEPETIFASDINPAAMQELHKQYGVQVDGDLQQMLAAVDTVVLAIKPQHMREVCQSFSTLLPTIRPLIVSIAAGIRIQAMTNWLGDETAIIRAMPNTPALINCGASGLFANSLARDEQKQSAESILAATGIVVWLDNEAQLDTVTALSGSGPAYFFRIMEGMIKSATELGLPADTARLLTLQTALGAATMASQGKYDLRELRRRVTSPGGTTEKGLQVMMDEDAIDLLMKQVIEAAQQRSVELADQLGES